MKYLVLAGSLLLPAGVATAQPTTNQGWTFSGEITAASDYRFRGISQTDRDPAVHLGLEAEYAAGSGWSGYAGVWASNVDFFDASAEIDLYGGFRRDLGAGQLDVLAIWYVYPGADSSLDYDYVEFGASYGVSQGPVSWEAGALWSPDYFGSSGNSVWVWAGGSYAVTERMSVTASAGRQWIADNAAFGTPDYWSRQAGLAYQAGPATLSLAWVDTSLSTSECGGNLCRGSLVGSISFGF